MSWTFSGTRALLAALSVSICLSMIGSGLAQQPAGAKQFREPVFRVFKNVSNTSEAANRPDRHPLDSALKIAYEGLHHSQANIRDYTATITRRELVNGKLSDYQSMFVKVRNRKTRDGQTIVPLSAYLKFTSPSSVAGREVVWVEGKNEGKLCAHEARGLISLKSWWLDPDGRFAMDGNKYPIYEIGVENLAAKLIEKGERDRKYGECEVKFYENAKINGRLCSVIKVIHPIRRDHFDFHIAQIYIDNEMNIPVRYAAWTWPEKEGGRPVLEEEYTYTNVKLNVGLTDADFSPNNPNYNFP